MTALGEIHAEHRVAGLQQRKVYGKIRLRTGMRLHIGMLRTEELAGAVTRNVFHNVDILAAAVIAMCRIALRVFVCQNCTHRRQNRRRNDVFGSDQLEIAALALELKLHGLADLGIRLR